MTDQLNTKAPATTPSKRDRLVQLLKRKIGASIEEISNENDWLPHSSRAALTGY